MNIPLVDLRAQYHSIKTEIDKIIQSVIEDNAFILGKYVKTFEEDFAKSIGIKHCIGGGNGTDALYLALKALGVGPGNEVITAANSFIATSEAISATGAKVVFADVDSKTYTIDVAKLESLISSRTKAIVPVHLYGHPADMNSILEIAEENNIQVVEDAAQAHLAEYRGKRLGSLGVMGSFSFYPGKNLGAYGDAGAIVTNDDGLTERIRMLANHGRTSKYDHEFEGVNSRMDGIQGGVLSVKLKYLQKWTEQRRKNADIYTELLKDVSDIVTPVEHPNAKHVYHLYVIRTKERDRLMEFLKSKGISTGIHYPCALPNLTAYKQLGHAKSDFPVSSRFQHEVMSLPMYSELSKEQIEYIVGNIKEFF